MCSAHCIAPEKVQLSTLIFKITHPGGSRYIRLWCPSLHIPQLAPFVPTQLSYLKFSKCDFCHLLASVCAVPYTKEHSSFNLHFFQNVLFYKKQPISPVRQSPFSEFSSWPLHTSVSTLPSLYNDSSIFGLSSPWLGGY